MELHYKPANCLSYLWTVPNQSEASQRFRIIFDLAFPDSLRERLIEIRVSTEPIERKEAKISDILNGIEFIRQEFPKDRLDELIKQVANESIDLRRILEIALRFPGLAKQSEEIFQKIDKARLNGDDLVILLKQNPFLIARKLSDGTYHELESYLLDPDYKDDGARVIVEAFLRQPPEHY